MCIFTNDIKHTSLTTYVKWGKQKVYPYLQHYSKYLYDCVSKTTICIFIEHCRKSNKILAQIQLLKLSDIQFNSLLNLRSKKA